jgi:hypothetical protein
MAKKNSDLFDRLREAGLRKPVARALSEIRADAGNKAQRRVRAAVSELRSLADELERRLPGHAPATPAATTSTPAAPAPRARTASTSKVAAPPRSTRTTAPRATGARAGRTSAAKPAPSAPKPAAGRPAAAKPAATKPAAAKPAASTTRRTTTRRTASAAKRDGDQPSSSS